MRDKQIRKRILIGSGIGAGVLLLILLMLLLLLAGGGRGRDAVAGRGTDAGPNEGSSGGLAEGVGDHNAEGTGSGANSEPLGTAEVEDELDGTGTMEEAAEDAGGSESPATEEPAVEESSEEDVPEEPPPPDPTFAVQELPGGSPAKGDGSAGGGRSGASGEGEFFGVKAKGRRFVYVVDCSGSMSGAPFMKACQELMDSIGQLNPQQQVYVIFFSNKSYPMFFPKPAHRTMLPVTKQNIARLQEWINDFNESGGTDPLEAVLHGLSLSPDAIFLLSDGIFARQIVDAIRLANKRKVVINTIAFMNRSGEPLLQQIADENRGEYRFVP